MERRFPVTNTILVLNIFVFVAMIAAGRSLQFTPRLLVDWGANFVPLTLLADQWWRLFTCTFVHANLLHIAFNMWCLWNIGRMAENIFGRFSFLCIYWLTGVSSSLLSCLVHPAGLSVGASGAIFGVAGALIPALRWGGLPFPREAVRSTLQSLLFFAGYNLFIGAAVAQIDNAGHIGGFVFGLLIGALLSRRLAAPPEEREGYSRAIFVLMVVLLLLAAWQVKKIRGPMLKGMQQTSWLTGGCRVG